MELVGITIDMRPDAISKAWCLCSNFLNLLREELALTAARVTVKCLINGYYWQVLSKSQQIVLMYTINKTSKIVPIQGSEFIRKVCC